VFFVAYVKLFCAKKKKKSWAIQNGLLFSSFIYLFSIYPYTGKTKDVEMVVIDVNVSVRLADVK